MGKRSASLLLLSLALTLTVAACSSGGGNGNSNGNNAAGTETGANNESTKDNNEATQLSIMWWGPDARHEATKNALAIYNQAACRRDV
ncbi:hypothetical protein [Paenibacillus sp. BC26]|uniref:hypothetical protein n=1 Tax=Paenibacillus sp. BC26 TaxID=1881032 RepID=UPI00210A2DD1|nr:hypothetical protein [Paenibacillus sp. BC26]